MLSRGPAENDDRQGQMGEKQSRESVLWEHLDENDNDDTVDESKSVSQPKHYVKNIKTTKKFSSISGISSLECSPMARETWVQSKVESYQRL